MSNLFPTVTGFRRGYEPGEVQTFFERARHAYEGGMPTEQFSADQIRRAAFPLIRGGYEVKKVDSALARLETAFVQRDRASYVAAYGEAAWFERVAEQATTLYPRLLRPHGERFSHPQNRAVGYSIPEVDKLMDRLGAFFDDRAEVTEADLRSALFRVTRGDKAYDENQVDAFLGRAIYVLTAVS